MRNCTKYLAVLVVICALLGITALAACTPTTKIVDAMYKDYTDLADNARYYDGNKHMSSFKISGKEAEKKGISIDLGAPTAFNTIALSENSRGVTMFSIFASNEPDLATFKLIYEGDTIEKYRTCFVGNVEYQYLRIDVVDSTSNYCVNDIKIYNNKNENTSKRVASYFLIDRVDTTDLRALDTVTDIILFSWMRFDQDGTIKHFIDNADWSGFIPEEEAEVKYQENLDKLMTAVHKVEAEQNRQINVFPTILMPWGKDGDANFYARAIMKDARKTAENVKAFIDKYGFDGVDFDYEYPYSNEEYKLFDNFLITVREVIGKDKILSSALGAWNIKMSKEAIDALDQVQLMTYDIFDGHGYHGAFYASMVNDMAKTINKGIPAEKINLGLPFYSRPISRAGYWGDYFRFYNEGLITSKYQNKVNYYSFDSGNYPINEPNYFNGYQMVQDKTAFAIDADVKGVMIWHMNCDVPYDTVDKDGNAMSLFKAIDNTFTAKGAHLDSHK